MIEHDQTLRTRGNGEKAGGYLGNIIGISGGLYISTFVSEPLAAGMANFIIEHYQITNFTGIDAIHKVMHVAYTIGCAIPGALIGNAVVSSVGSHIGRGVDNAKRYFTRKSSD
tara:strand:+ start:1559 stop:1897 length:339 start_codon:yes stop_codon:yes gene_type:complete